MKKNITHRRQFLKGTGCVAAGFAGLHRFLAFATAADQPYQNQIAQLGKLVRDPKRIIDLPEGFSYRVLSTTGDTMSDGLKTPGRPDGMGAFAGEDGRVIIVRNHELEDQWTFEGAYGISNELLDSVDASKIFDAGKGIQPQLGGTSTIVYDPVTGQVERDFMSLAGTSRNCAGGADTMGQLDHLRGNRVPSEERERGGESKESETGQSEERSGEERRG